MKIVKFTLVVSVEDDRWDESVVKELINDIDSGDVTKNIIEENRDIKSAAMEYEYLHPGYISINTSNNVYYSTHC